MDRVRALAHHISPQQAASGAVFQAAVPHSPPQPLLQLEDPSAELVAQHAAGSGILWKGPKAHVDKAMELFNDRGITNFPEVDIEKEVALGLASLHTLLEGCEAQKPRADAAAWRLQHCLLTGATGFIGIHFLAKFVVACPHSHVCCLVRGRNPEHCMERLRAQAKVFFLDEVIGEEGWRRVSAIPGDIKLQRFGLSEADYQELSLSSQTVVHLAAKDNFFLPFDIIRGAHIEGFLNVVEFCAHQQVKSLMHVSTCKARLVEELKGKIVPDDGLYNGYAQSKFVAHRMAEELARLRGKMQCVPPISLINMGYVHSQTWPPSVPDVTDAWEVMLKVCLDKGLVPDVDTPMDFAPISYVCDCLVEILENGATEPTAAAGEDQRWLEVYAPKGLEFRDIIEIMQEIRKENGLEPLQVVSVAEFQQCWYKMLFDTGSFAAKCLSLLFTRSWGRQANMVFHVGPDLYRSPKHGATPALSREYVVELIRTIDKQMVLPSF